MNGTHKSDALDRVAEAAFGADAFVSREEALELAINAGRLDLLQKAGATARRIDTEPQEPRPAWSRSWAQVEVVKAACKMGTEESLSLAREITEQIDDPNVRVGAFIHQGETGDVEAYHAALALVPKASKNFIYRNPEGVQRQLYSEIGQSMCRQGYIEGVQSLPTWAMPEMEKKELLVDAAINAGDFERARAFAEDGHDRWRIEQLLKCVRAGDDEAVLSLDEALSA